MPTKMKQKDIVDIKQYITDERGHKDRKSVV